MNKRSGGRFQESCVARCGVFWRTWQKRYFSITSEGVSYSIGPELGEQSKVRDMMIFSKTFNIYFGKTMTGYKRGIILENLQRKLLIEALDDFQFYDFLYAIQEAYQSSDYNGSHNFESFAPQRQNVYCKWYIDGENYYNDMLQALNEAQSEVYITDWWLSPQILLQRPDTDDSSRLDNVLLKLAKRGVLIKILVYTESKLALTIDSGYTKQYLEKLHPNIMVQRHPGYIFPFLWSHHEKIVIIDQTVAFMGGLDLCYGRWDNSKHALFDPSPNREDQLWPGIDYSNARMADFTNVQAFQQSTISRTSTPRLPWHDIALRIVGMPVRDLSVHFIAYWNFACLDLEYRDKARTIQTTNLHSQVKFFDKIKNKIEQYRHKHEDNKTFLLQEQTLNSMGNENIKSPKKQKKKKQMISLAEYDQDFLQNIEEQIIKNKELITEEDEKEGDNNQYLIEQNQDQLLEDQETDFQTDNYIQSRKPIKIQQQSQDKESLDIEKCYKSENRTINQQNLQVINVKKRQVKSFIYGQEQRAAKYSPIKINFRRSYSTDKKDQYNFENLDNDMLQTIAKILKNKNEQDDLLHGFENPQNPQVQSLAKGVLYKYTYEDNEQDKKKQIDDLTQQIQEKNLQKSTLILKPERRKKIEKNGNCLCQIVRSSSLWSCGIKESECSIHIAYVQLIGMAQNFIYIENQFFISSLAGDPVQNEVANQLFIRIRLAILNQQKFRVIVVMPLLPAFMGEIDSSGILRCQLYWQYKTICRGEKSLYEQIKKLGVDPFDYITFYGLRTHGRIDNKSLPVTEIVYVHSKLMIVDDKFVILGSANINDRSLLGSRDSEIGAVIEDKQKVVINMNGQYWQANDFAHSLRKSLFQEHFALNSEQAMDPLCDDTYKQIRQIAQVYRQIFRCYPDDNIKKSSELAQFSEQKKLDQYDTLKQEIQGYAVEFPLCFLENENLDLTVANKEYLAPTISFT